MNKKNNNISNTSSTNKELHENNQANEKKVFCDECNFEWNYKDTILFESEFENSSGDKLFVIAFSCKQCGKEFLVAVNDVNTLAGFDELRRIKESLEKLRTRAQGKPTPSQLAINKSLIKKHKEIVNRIGKHQSQLKEFYLSRKSELTLVKQTEVKK